MSFQWVFDTAEEISITNQPVVGQTISRNGVVKAVKRADLPMQISVKVPDGIRWSDYRSNITESEYLGTHTQTTIQIDNSGYNHYLFGYKGDATSRSGFTATSFSQNNATLASVGAGLDAGEVVLAAGDYIQVGAGGNIYQVAETIIHPSTSITVTRPFKGETGTKTLLLGEDIVWPVLCIGLPKWNVFGYNQVAFNGTYDFMVIDS